MKVVIFGGTGTIGRSVVHELSSRHQVISVGKNSGDHHCDITDLQQVRELLQEMGEFDSLISTVGHVHFGVFEKMTGDLYEIGLQDKLMGQVYHVK